jgi:hypothetical protein
MVLVLWPQLANSHMIQYGNTDTVPPVRVPGTNGMYRYGTYIYHGTYVVRTYVHVYHGTQCICVPFSNQKGVTYHTMVPLVPWYGNIVSTYTYVRSRDNVRVCVPWYLVMLMGHVNVTPFWLEKGTRVHHVRGHGHVMSQRTCHGMYTCTAMVPWYQWYHLVRTYTCTYVQYVRTYVHTYTYVRTRVPESCDVTL